MCLAFTLAEAAASFAAPPQTPLAAPLFSFDLASPAVPEHAAADDVLALDQPYPITAIDGGDLGLGDPADELDALSTCAASLGTTIPFSLIFSVTRESTGAAPPDPVFVALGVPYNVADQASRGHQAGDSFMSTLLFTRSESPDPEDAGNSVLVRNNYDEGGTDHAARPETSAHTVSVGEAQDNVDALCDAAVLGGIYFSVSQSSPSLASLPGESSSNGATIFHYGLATTIFASAAELGLPDPMDDLDALVVFDFDLDGDFDDSDQVLFSLTPDSPSLPFLIGASASGAAADVFSVEPGEAPRLFASAANLGLGSESDDIDGLEILPCGNAAVCASAHGIRLVPGDFNDDGNVDAADREAFEDCYNGENQPYESGCGPGDFDQDADIDCGDWVGFTNAWTGGGTLSGMSQCADVIPAVSAWGMVIVTLLFLAAGSAVLSAGRQARPAEATANSNLDPRGSELHVH